MSPPAFSSSMKRESSNDSSSHNSSKSSSRHRSPATSLLSISHNINNNNSVINQGSTVGSSDDTATTSTRSMNADEEGEPYNDASTVDNSAAASTEQLDEVSDDQVSTTVPQAPNESLSVQMRQSASEEEKAEEQPLPQQQEPQRNNNQHGPTSQTKDSRGNFQTRSKSSEPLGQNTAAVKPLPPHMQFSSFVPVEPTASTNQQQVPTSVPKVIRRQGSSVSWDMENSLGSNQETANNNNSSRIQRKSSNFNCSCCSCSSHSGKGSHHSSTSNNKERRHSHGSGRSRHSHRHHRKVLHKANSIRTRRVRFSHVHVREYDVCIGDNPYCSYGPPLSLDWHYFDYKNDIPISVYENQYVLPKQAMKRRSRRSLVLSATERRARLWRSGYSLEEIDEAAEALDRERWRKSVLGNFGPIIRLQEAWVLYVNPIVNPRGRRYRQQYDELARIEQRVRDEHSSIGSSVAAEGMMSGELINDQLQEDGDDVIDLEAEVNGVVIEGMGTLEVDEENNLVSISRSNSQEKSNSNNADSNSGKEKSKDSHRSGESSMDSETMLAKYGILVDKKQHDRAREIRLCSLRRPHMRAFHASWFSFFMAFFSWFAVTPLLSEIQETLGLSKGDVWVSSLFGTAGTIVCRIVMGPLCDKFGARICMAAVLILAAIPTAFTGAVQTALGLWLVRLFIGIGGASFVACQYWTSQMFNREVVGTANATVAGWGNLGGGVTNLIMGSALFPLFRWFYGGDDRDDGKDSSELAWRTVFVVPAVLAIATAIAILFYSDDSPKGSYKDRIMDESLAMSSPVESLQKAAKNWNVWILSLQYACCFGVEVTMTNASALYFKDEFGQSTVSAAGIASIFGFMNLFARGWGGMVSDWFQRTRGFQGRLAWQLCALVLEGIGVGLFAYANTLATSLVALVYLSIMVQSAEGSTFGIVPYVDRRYTGSVVGIVGSGGNVGAAVFSVFFVEWSYKAAFTFMGISAAGSAFFCFLLNKTKLSQTYEAVTKELEEREKRESEFSSAENDSSRVDTSRHSMNNQPYEDDYGSGSSSYEDDGNSEVEAPPARHEQFDDDQEKDSEQIQKTQKESQLLRQQEQSTQKPFEEQVLPPSQGVPTQDDAQ